MPTTWTFRLAGIESRSRRLIVEGYAFPPYGRPYYDDLFFYSVVGPGYLSMEMSRDFDGERLMEFLITRLGPPAEEPRIQVGGRQDEEEGALLLAEWHFPPELRPEMIKKLSDILSHPLEAPA